jgi:hypothetical protein
MVLLRRVWLILLEVVRKATSISKYSLNTLLDPSQRMPCSAVVIKDQ